MPAPRAQEDHWSTTSPLNREPNVHVVIVRGDYVDLIEQGLKTIESRLSIHRSIPFSRVRSGDLLLIKQHSGPYRLCVTVGEVWSFELLTRAGLRHLRETFGSRIAAGASYWRYKRRSRFATLVELVEPRAVSHGPVLGGLARSGWVTLGSITRPENARYLPPGACKNLRANPGRTLSRRASA